MKIALCAVIAVLLWQSEGARQFTSDALLRAAEIVDPKPHGMTIGETIDSLIR